ncbi:MAG: cobyrinate a,c-diamide synthase [Leptothrix ochracea]|uniref:cobyrinate a,c-diamide synthase n=1 Tax=Leptothrix ochracea TaxID=735331 RepID=UPI0034E2E6E8
MSDLHALPRVLISAAHKSSGKTTLSLGLCAALRAQGTVVQPFKKGPDYIDPMWLGRAAGRPCYNLDPHLMSADEIRALVLSRCVAGGGDLALIEGNKGLFDGLALDGSNSNAALAHQLAAPVVLVIDARGMTRGIAPLLLGYQAFDPALALRGVILNRVGGSRHESKLRAVIEHYTDMQVLGAVPEDPRLAMTERHLGLVPGNEAEEADAVIARIAHGVAASVDLAALLALARKAVDVAPNAPAWSWSGLIQAAETAPATKLRRDLRIGVAMDRAFGFYYPDDAEALQALGAELVPFDTVNDTNLPPRLDGLFIGGGFPETSAHALAANAGLRSQIRQAIEAGLPTYAECGGLMYLARGLSVDGQRHPMVGVIPGEVEMHARPVGRGYVALEASADHPWGVPQGTAVRAHEFHYSSLHLAGPGPTLEHPVRFAWRMRRGHGIDGQQDGLVIHNLLASYSHLRRVGGCDWPLHFIAKVQQVRDERARAELLGPSLFSHSASLASLVSLEGALS